MPYLIVLLFFYVQYFLPVVFEYRNLGILVLTLFLYIFRHFDRVALYILLIILLFSIFSTSLSSSNMSIPIEEKDLNGLYGQVVTEPNRKKHRYTGCTVLLESVVNRRGDFFSSSGRVYVIGPDLGATKGDMIYVEGTMTDSCFLSSGGAVTEASIYGKLRRKVNTLLIRNLPRGNTGNLIALLLTGTTLDGDSSLQDSVRELGLSHLLSLSGMHLGYISAFVLPVLALFLSKKKAKSVKNLILMIFVYLAGLRPSLVRSLIFVLLIPFFGIDYSFILSLVFLLKLFPYYVSEVATVLSFTSLAGILFIARPQKFLEERNIPFISGVGVSVMTSIAATVSSAPIVYSVFGTWQPYSFLFSIVGMPVISFLFLMTVVRFIIPKSDAIIEFILEIVSRSDVISRYFPLTSSFEPYFPLAVSLTVVVGALMLLERRRK